MIQRLLEWLQVSLFGQRPSDRQPQQLARSPVRSAPPDATCRPSRQAGSASLAKPAAPTIPPLPPPPPRTYAERAFDCTSVREAALAFVGADVSKEQRGLVLSEAGAQAVAAGAGSGKSTTLVKRLLLMRHHLKTSLNDITVFTFTRNSRADFIEKLLETAASLNVTLTQEQAEDRVRTFHSKLLRLAGPAMPAGAQIFEFLGKASKPKPGSPEEAAYLQQLAALADEEENPYDRNTSAEQADILREVYEGAYSQDENFRKAIFALVRFAHRDIKKPGVDEREEGDWANKEKAQWRDSELTKWLETYWRRQCLWPIEGVSKPPRDLRVSELAFKANGYIATFDVFIVLAGWRLPSDEVNAGGTKFRPSWSSGSKRNILLRGCPDAILFVQKADDIERVHALLTAETAVRAGRAPIFECRLPGDGGKRQPIFEALYQLGVFIENIGLRPADMYSALKGKQHSDLDRHTLYAVSCFFKHFEAHKKSEGFVTFNDLFFLLREGSPALKGIPTAQLKSMKHLLIDEFQDISPLIVSMISGVHKEIITRSAGAEQPTLLVVGDDWQSIYGWRGSAPRFFLDFAKIFAGANPTPVILEDNYRSSRNIVECAAQVLRPVSAKFKMEKTCRASNSNVANLPHPVFLVEELTDNDIARVLAELASLCDEGEELLVVARTGKIKAVAEKARKRLPQKKNIKVMTVHSSKGLQAEYVLVLEDFAYSNENLLRKALYEQAGFTQNYNDSQRDEARRVAYVALTRAKKLCVWMGKPFDGGAMSSIPGGQPYCRRLDVELLIDELNNKRDGARSQVGERRTAAISAQTPRAMRPTHTP